MLEFDAGVFTIVMRDLSNAAAMLVLPILNGHGSDKASTVGERLNDALARVSVDDPATGFLPIPVRLRSKATRLLGRILADEITISETNTLIRDLHNDIIISMGSLHFLMIDPSRLSYYTQKEPPFGVEVALKFHEAFADIEAASRCVALEEWTAVVFHLMRVLERGLHALALELRVAMSPTIEYEQWYNIIDQVEAEIRKLEKSLPKGADKVTKMEFYSGVATNFRYFKDAWRNHVAHARSTYDERSAMKVFTHVKAFTEELAGGLA